MKEAIGLAVFAMVTVFSIGMAVGRRIDAPVLTVLLLFGMVSGWGIAHHDWVRQVQFQVPGFELFQTQINQIKDDALYEMKKSASTEREAIAALLATSEELRQKLSNEGKPRKTSPRRSRPRKRALRSVSCAPRKQASRCRSPATS